MALLELDNPHRYFLTQASGEASKFLTEKSITDRYASLVFLCHAASISSKFGFVFIVLGFFLRLH